MSNTYSPPLPLTIISSIFLGIGAISALIITVDIILRRGWKSMMAIMIPVWPINAAYMGPVTLFLYFKYGRPDKPGAGGKRQDDDRGMEGGGKDGMDGMMAHGGEHHHHHHHQHHPPASHAHAHGADESVTTPKHSQHLSSNASSDLEKQTTGVKHEDHHHHNHHQQQHHHSAIQDSQIDHTNHEAHDTNAHSGHKSTSSPQPGNHMDHSSHAHDHSGHHMPSPNRPQWATVMVGVSHCGAGCVLGDIIGEWLVYGTSLTINHASLWPALLIDFGFALLLGIIFQYFSIAPMSGDYGIKTLLRAAKADVLSLVSFEVGLFGWMIVFQVGIWSHGLPTDVVVYWWMMQVGMFLGFWTAFPVNWWLISKGVKEACA